MNAFAQLAANARALSASMPVTYQVEIEDGKQWIAEQAPHADLDDAVDEYMERRDDDASAIVWEIHPDNMREDVTAKVDRIIRVRCDVRFLDYPEWMEAEYADQQRDIAGEAAHVRSERFGWEVV